MYLDAPASNASHAELRQPEPSSIKHTLQLSHAMLPTRHHLGAQPAGTTLPLCIPGMQFTTSLVKHTLKLPHAESGKASGAPKRHKAEQSAAGVSSQASGRAVGIASNTSTPDRATGDLDVQPIPHSPQPTPGVSPSTVWLILHCSSGFRALAQPKAVRLHGVQALHWHRMQPQTFKDSFSQ